MEKERLSKLGPGKASYADLPQKFQDALKIVKYDDDLPYVVGYKGFRVGVKARNFHGENFHNVSLKARNEAKVIPVKWMFIKKLILNYNFIFLFEIYLKI